MEAGSDLDVPGQDPVDLGLWDINGGAQKLCDADFLGKLLGGLHALEGLLQGRADGQNAVVAQQNQIAVLQIGSGLIQDLAGAGLAIGATGISLKWNRISGWHF